MTVAARANTALEVVNRIGNVLATAVAGVVAAMAAVVSATFAIGGPISLSIVAIGGLIVAVTGKEAAMKKLQSVELYSWVRKTRSEEALKARLRKQSAAFEQELADAFTKAFTSSAKDRLADSVSGAVEEHLKMLADQAEVLISMPAPPSS
ncbi:hypothetical protein [Actinocrispum wychmicini]|nr:hypothetical protein [Actinocrispum wychmicini]